jgi:glycosyltransferase involved in cell wall biosynthesis
VEQLREVLTVLTGDTGYERASHVTSSSGSAQISGPPLRSRGGATVAAVSLTVAVDVGPLVGARTGIGHMVEHQLAALAATGEVETFGYLSSFRAPLPENTRRLRYPARIALALWAHSDHPRADRTLRGADVVHGTNYVVPPTRLPTVVTVPDTSLITSPSLVLPIVRRFVPVLQRAVARGAWVHAISDHVADQIRVLLDTDRVRTVHLAAPDRHERSIERPGVPGLEHHPYVVFIGAREPRKNLPRLVSAFGMVAGELPDLRLVLAGPSGPDSAAVDAALDALNPAAAERVIVTDYLPASVRDALVDHAVVFAYPSLDEGFGLPLLDAMGAGVPVVAGDAGALPEVAGGAAVMVDPLDTEAIAEGLRRAITDDALRAELIEAGRRRVEKFTWSDTADGLIGLYREAVEAKRS